VILLRYCCVCTAETINRSRRRRISRGLKGCCCMLSSNTLPASCCKSVWTVFLLWWRVSVVTRSRSRRRLSSLPPRANELCFAQRLSVCLFSVCLLATLRKYYWSDLREKFARDVFMDKEKLIIFRKSPASASRNFKMILQHCKIEHFSTIWLISLDKTDKIFTKISWRLYQLYLIFGQGSPR